MNILPCKLLRLNAARLQSLLHSLLPSVRRSLSITAATFFGLGHVNRVAGVCDFDRVAVGSLGIPPFEVGVDGSVSSRCQHPDWFASTRSRGDDRF